VHVVNLSLFGSLLEERRQVSTFFAKDHLAFDDNTVTEKSSRWLKSRSRNPKIISPTVIAQVARSVKRKRVASLKNGL
jgi:hypothetical protein